MINCPQCQAENEDDARVCQQCSAELVAAPAGDDLPPWLQALKPDHRAEADDEAIPAPIAEPVAVAAGGAKHEAPASAQEAPTPARPVASAPATAPVAKADSGTDTVVATQPTPIRRPAPTEAPRAANPPAAPQSGTTDTASLISEDDLPSWLRAFSENDGGAQSATVDDQSWMTGGDTGQAADALTANLAQSWQAPARVAASQRTGAVSVFGASDEGRGKVARVEKAERVVAPVPAPAAPAPAPGQKLSAPLPTVGAKPAAPARLGSNRAVPPGAERAGASIQRLATIAFLVAFVIFLIVLGIFVVAPALRG